MTMKTMSIEEMEKEILYNKISNFIDIFLKVTQDNEPEKFEEFKNCMDFFIDQVECYIDN